MTYSHDGKMIASASDDNKIAIWDAQKFKYLYKIEVAVNVWYFEIAIYDTFYTGWWSYLY